MRRCLNTTCLHWNHVFAHMHMSTGMPWNDERNTNRLDCRIQDCVNAASSVHYPSELDARNLGITSEITISLSPLILLPSQSTHAQVYFLLNSKVLPPTYVHKGRAGLLSLSLSLNSKVGQEGRRRSQKAVCSLLGLKVSFLNHLKPIRSVLRGHVFFDRFRRVPISRDC